MALEEDIHVHTKRRILTRVLIGIFVLFFARLYQLQMLFSDEYGKQSEVNSIRAVPREPVRGYIYDRTGRLVVDNRPSFSVSIMPFEFDKQSIPYLSSLLSLDPAFITDRLKKGETFSRFVPVKIKRDIDFRELSSLEENRDRLPGVDEQIESKRAYVTAAFASHLLGYTKEISDAQLRSLSGDYTQGDVVGSNGLEAEYEEALRGRKGEEYSTVNVRGQVIGKFENGKADVPAIEGNDLILSLDFGLQAFAESLMTNKSGAVVALDPQDGSILALVSKPDYDLSLFSGVTPPQVWNTLNADASAPLFNRATLARYPPGSTFKMILAIAALETRTVSPFWRITCTGAFRVGRKVFKDLHIHGSVDMYDAIEKSCNVYFCNLIMKTGLDAWTRYGEAFGFGRLTGVDLPEENPGLLPSTEYMNARYGEKGWTKGFLPNFAIGQGEIGVTPLQMACYAMGLATCGVFHEPHAVMAVVNKTTRTIDTLRHDSRSIHVSASTWKVVREGMRRVVEEPGGTGALARVKGVVVAGKTGTAQNPHGADHAWFVAFAPFDNPKIAIAVLVENAGFGGTQAAPIAGLCIERYLYGRLIRYDSQNLVKTVRSNAGPQGRQVLTSTVPPPTDTHALVRQTP